MSVLVKCRWRTSVFGTTMVLDMWKQFSTSFQTALMSFARLDLDVQYSGIRLNLFQKFRCNFTVDVNSFLDFERLLKKL